MEFLPDLLKRATGSDLIRALTAALSAGAAFFGALAGYLLVARDRPRFRVLIRRRDAEDEGVEWNRGPHLVIVEIINTGWRRGYVFPPKLWELDEHLLLDDIPPTDVRTSGPWEPLREDRYDLQFSLEPGESIRFAFHYFDSATPLYIDFFDSRAKRYRSNVRRGALVISAIASLRHRGRDREFKRLFTFHFGRKGSRHEMPDAPPESQRISTVLWKTLTNKLTLYQKDKD